MRDFVDDAIARLLKAGVVTPDHLEGCTEQDIALVEATCRIKLPGAYKSFLSKMGRRAGDFLKGTDYLFPLAANLRAAAERLLRECGNPASLRDIDLVFAVHQGYEFLFMSSDASNDPPVLLYEEAATSFRTVAGSFSTWLTMCADDEIAAAAAIEDPQ